jgi:hypothetical protein
VSVKEFQQKGYTVVRNALKPDITSVVTQYALFDEMQDFTPDGSQVPNAHSKYADPLMESMLMHIHPIMEKATGLQLHPTYSFYRVYRNGDVLEPHKDRPSCEISTTVCFGYSYDDSEYSWPIIMDGNAVNMKPGDIVVYRGVDLEHSRDEFTPPRDDWHVQAFLHYVDVNGPFADYKFDGRNSVGALKNVSRVSNKSYITFI